MDGAKAREGSTNTTTDSKSSRGSDILSARGTSMAAAAAAGILPEFSSDHDNHKSAGMSSSRVLTPSVTAVFASSIASGGASFFSLLIPKCSCRNILFCTTSAHILICFLLSVAVR